MQSAARDLEQVECERYEEMDMAAIGEVMGLSRERIRQVYNVAERKVRIGVALQQMLPADEAHALLDRLAYCPRLKQWEQVYRSVRRKVEHGRLSVRLLEGGGEHA